MDDHAGGLVDREQMVVLIQHVEREIFRRHADPGGVVWQEDADVSTGMGTRRDTAHRLAVHADLPVFNPDLNLRSRRRGDVREMAPQHEIETPPGVAPIRDDVATRRKKCHRLPSNGIGRRSGAIFFEPDNETTTNVAVLL